MAVEHQLGGAQTMRQAHRKGLPSGARNKRMSGRRPSATTQAARERGARESEAGEGGAHPNGPADGDVDTCRHHRRNPALLPLQALLLLLLSTQLVMAAFSASAAAVFTATASDVAGAIWPKMANFGQPTRCLANFGRVWSNSTQFGRPSPVQIWLPTTHSGQIWPKMATQNTISSRFGPHRHQFWWNSVK